MNHLKVTELTSFVVVDTYHSFHSHSINISIAFHSPGHRNQNHINSQMRRMHLVHSVCGGNVERVCLYDIAASSLTFIVLHRSVVADVVFRLPCARCIQ